MDYFTDLSVSELEVDEIIGKNAEISRAGRGFVIQAIDLQSSKLLRDIMMRQQLNINILPKNFGKILLLTKNSY